MTFTTHASSERHLCNLTFTCYVLFQLNFIGVTVERNRRYIHFNSDQFMFAPVPIGQKNSPVQVYELFNGGAMSVKYSFGLAQLEFLNQVTKYKESIMLLYNQSFSIIFILNFIFCYSMSYLSEIVTRQ